jgi:hypothetical protein
MRPRPEVGAVGFLADEVGSYRELLEVLRSKRRLTIRGHQVAVRFPPSVPVEGRTASFECSGRSHRRLPGHCGIAMGGSLQSY